VFCTLGIFHPTRSGGKQKQTHITGFRKERNEFFCFEAKINGSTLDKSNECSSTGR
jgi:hypothetical protein